MDHLDLPDHLEDLLFLAHLDNPEVWALPAHPDALDLRDVLELLEPPDLLDLLDLRDLPDHLDLQDYKLKYHHVVAEVVAEVVAAARPHVYVKTARLIYLSVEMFLIVKERIIQTRLCSASYVF